MATAAAPQTSQAPVCGPQQDKTTTGKAAARSCGTQDPKRLRHAARTQIPTELTTRVYERAKTAAREAESAALLAHAIAEQAFVLIDLDETSAAVDQLAHARSIAECTATPLLRAWLAAAHGEILAAAGHADGARRAFDIASALLPADPIDPALPFLFLSGSHLDRWRGNALARLGTPDAIDQLTGALARLPADFVRARTGLLVDLAYAHAATGDREATLTHAQQARRLAAAIKSDRHQRRLNRLVLPGGGTAA